jgi:hypothetical protein
MYTLRVYKIAFVGDGFVYPILIYTLRVYNYSELRI